ncbi:hypothetical protein SORDD14_01481 [Streptococcus oralis]|uniref:Uncharacterized protein n=1 Tax=Streptococcus oralis TaxID=1303 RepID=A0A139NWN3_STROR|nr:hypothetical protein [Streptococcus oralis]KXT80405.1 hypothetical protein SORDD14_01481 [Streptococcus oralis]
MNFLKIMAKTYGSYFFIMKSAKVAKSIKEDENLVTGIGKMFLADKLMDTAQWLAKPEDKE